MTDYHRQPTALEEAAKELRRELPHFDDRRHALSEEWLRQLAEVLNLFLDDLPVSGIVSSTGRSLLKTAFRLAGELEMRYKFPGSRRIAMQINSVQSNLDEGDIQEILREAGGWLEWVEVSRDVLRTRVEGRAVMHVTVDPGSASPEEIAEILADLSVLYRRMGGSGINFSPQDVHILAPSVP